MIVLGRRNSSNVQKVLWCLEELGRPFVREDYGGNFGRNKDPEYLRLNPNGVVPTLVDGDVVVWESNTICRYLCNRFGPTPLYPENVEMRARTEMWMDWQLASLNPVMTPLYVGMIRAGPAKRDEAALALLAGRAGDLFGLMDGALEGGDFLAGRSMTLADLVLAIFFYRWVNLDIPRPSLPRAECWYDRLGARPGFKEHVAIGLS